MLKLQFSRILQISWYRFSVKGDKHQGAKFGVICWAIWHWRNKMHLNKPIESVDQINAFAQSYLDEFAQCNSREETKSQHCPVIKWKVLVNCRYKINFNGAVFCEKEEAGLGVVIRNGQGLPMASLIQKIRFPHSVESIEALAAKRAIQFALELGLQEGEFEGDLEIIVKALKDDRPSHAPFGLIVEDARALSSNLEKVQFNHVKR